MAWAQVPKTGKYAPCNPPSCGHLDCAEQIRTIRTECPLCEENIGFEKYCADENGRLVHFACALKEAEQ